MDKKINITTVAKRMNRILAAYREQCLQETDDAAAVVASTSSSTSSASIGQSNCTPEQKMVLDKPILNYAAQIYDESHSDSDLSDSFDVESPPKRRCKSTLTRYMKTVDHQPPSPSQQQQQQQSKRRRQPSRTVKRAAVKLTSLDSKRVQRKVTCTVTSNASPDHSNLSDRSTADDLSDSPMTVAFSESDNNDDGDDSDAGAVAKPVKSSVIIKTTSKATCVQPM